MDISSFLNSYPGTHIVQAFFHSLIAAVIVDRSIHAWGITSPLVRQRFRIMVILLPLFSYPLYQLIDPARGSVSFRLGALFDSGRWLSLELWGAIPVSLLFAAFLLLTAFIFIFQELVPILRHAAESRESEVEWDRPQEGSPVLAAVKALGGEKPEVFIADDEDLLIYSTTGNKPAVFISSGLMGALEPAELEVAIAHEMAHIRRSRRPLLIITYIVRVLQFFSPATLVEFRKIVEDEEKICDDEAAGLTGKPGALASTLRKLKIEEAGQDGAEGRKPAKVITAMESMSHDILLERRIRRLGNEARQTGGGQWLSFTVTIAAVLVVNYFVV
ncbi:MAG: M56 family metallopeptidase [Nitrospirota bacterium]|jgi:Zn-dependent protease with chaperone function